MEVGGKHTHTLTHMFVETLVEDMLRFKCCGKSRVGGGENARCARAALNARGQVCNNTSFGIMPVMK